MKTVVSNSPEQTRNLARSLLPLLLRAHTVGLVGNLGTGKTEFVKGIAQALGIRSSLQSPTFVLRRTYRFGGKKNGFLEHLDLYRISRSSEAGKLEIADLVRQKNRLVLIEWPGRVSRFLPPTTAFIYFRHGKTPNQRRITILAGKLRHKSRPS